MPTAPRLRKRGTEGNASAPERAQQCVQPPREQRCGARRAPRGVAAPWSRRGAQPSHGATVRCCVARAAPPPLGRRTSARHPPTRRARRGRPWQLCGEQGTGRVSAACARRCHTLGRQQRARYLAPARRCAPAERAARRHANTSPRMRCGATHRWRGAARPAGWHGERCAAGRMRRSSRARWHARRAASPWLRCVLTGAEGSRNWARGRGARRRPRGSRPPAG